MQPKVVVIELVFNFCLEKKLILGELMNCRSLCMFVEVRVRTFACNLRCFDRVFQRP